MFRDQKKVKRLFLIAAVIMVISMIMMTLSPLLYR